MQEKEEDIRVILNELVFQGLVKVINSNEYELVKTYDSLRKIILRLEDKKFELVRSRYLDSLINDDFVNFVSGRFKINLNIKQKEDLITICKLFPKVVEIMIGRPVNDYENPYNQMLNRS